MWRWAKDKWTSREDMMVRVFGHSLASHDKVCHFMGGWMAYSLLYVLTGSLVLSTIIAAAFWWLWEVKDALVPYETVGWLGGDGFSWKDGVAATVGIGCSIVVVALCGNIIGLLSNAVIFLTALLIRPKQ